MSNTRPIILAPRVSNPRLRQALLFVKILAFTALCFAGIGFGVLMLSARHTLQHTNTVLDSADAVVKDADAVTQRAGLLEKQASYLILQAGLTADQARKASIKEAAMLDDVNARVQSTLADLDTFVVTSRDGEKAVLETTNHTIAGIDPVLTATRQNLEQLQIEQQHLDTLITNPDIPASFANTRVSTAATATAMNNVAATTGDVREAVHHYLHPTWQGKVADWSLKIVHALNPF